MPVADIAFGKIGGECIACIIALVTLTALTAGGFFLGRRQGGSLIGQFQHKGIGTHGEFHAAIGQGIGHIAVGRTNHGTVISNGEGIAKHGKGASAVTVKDDPAATHQFHHVAVHLLTAGGEGEQLIIGGAVSRRVHSLFGFFHCVRGSLDFQFGHIDVDLAGFLVQQIGEANHHRIGQVPQLVGQRHIQAVAGIHIEQVVFADVIIGIRTDKNGGVFHFHAALHGSVEHGPHEGFCFLAVVGVGEGCNDGIIAVIVRGDVCAGVQRLIITDLDQVGIFDFFFLVAAGSKAQYHNQYQKHSQ